MESDIPLYAKIARRHVTPRTVDLKVILRRGWGARAHAGIAGHDYAGKAYTCIGTCNTN